MGRDVVTYPQLADKADEYEYDETVGRIGGFVYYKTDTTDPVFSQHIVLENIGPVLPCVPAVHTADIQKVCHTSVELPDIAMGTPYGWCHKHNAWVYFTHGTDHEATHMSSYTVTVM